MEKLQIVDLFDAVAGGTEVLRSKPAPDVFELCAKKLNVACAECIVLEDARAGIQAALAAGMTAVGIGLPEMLTEADFVVKSVQDLNLEILSRLMLENQRLIGE